MTDHHCSDARTSPGAAMHPTHASYVPAETKEALGK